MLEININWIIKKMLITYSGMKLFLKFKKIKKYIIIE